MKGKDSSWSFILQSLIKQDIITPRVKEVMLKVDRGDFCPSTPYQDCPQYIGFGATISAPHMHGYALKFMEGMKKKPKKALDVGSGSGYLTVAFFYMMDDPLALSYGVEHIKELVDFSLENISKSHLSLLGKNLFIEQGDGRKGLPQYGPFDFIHVGAAAEKVPAELLS